VLFARHEWEHQIGGSQPELDAAKDGAFKPVFSKSVRRGLKPIFETRVRRTVYPIRSGDSEIELTVEKGKVEAGRQSSPLCEWNWSSSGANLPSFQTRAHARRGGPGSARRPEQGRARLCTRRRRGSRGGQGGTGRARAGLQPASRLSSRCQDLLAPPRRQSNSHAARRPGGSAIRCGSLCGRIASSDLIVCRHAA
jgi:hypothetical protein